MGPKKRTSVLVIYAIVFVLFSIVYFISPFEKSSVSWITCVFSWLAIVASYKITIYAFGKGEDLRSKVYGVPVFRLGVFYLAVQMGLCVGFSVVGALIDVAVWIAILFEAVLVALVAIGVIVSDNARDIISEVEQSAQVNTRPITYFKLDVEDLVSSCGDADTKKLLEKLAEDIRYSDPVSKPELYDIERSMVEQVGVIESALKQEDYQKVAEEIQMLSNTLESRNRRCKAVK